MKQLRKANNHIISAPEERGESGTENVFKELMVAFSKCSKVIQESEKKIR